MAHLNIHKKLKLNLGCGDKTPEGWVNVDYALGAWLFKIPCFAIFNKKFKLFNIKWSEKIFLHDLREKLPWEDNSVDVIYSSHTLEHLFLCEAKTLLQECYRVLKPNGIIRIVVPDLKSYVVKYVAGKISAIEFLDALSVHYTRPQDKLLKKILAPVMSFPHKCMYDKPSLIEIMSEIGFEVKSKNFLESEISNLAEIEDSGRTIDALIVEGNKRLTGLEESENCESNIDELMVEGELIVEDLTAINKNLLVESHRE